MTYAGTLVARGRGQAVVVVHRHVDGVRSDRPTGRDGRSQPHAPAGEPRSPGCHAGQGGARRRGARHRHRHRTRPAGDRDVHVRHCAGRRGRPRGLARGRDDFAGDRRPADGQAQRARPTAAHRGDAGQHVRHLHRQDRHPDQERDDRPAGVRRTSTSSSCRALATSPPARSCDARPCRRAAAGSARAAARRRAGVGCAARHPRRPLAGRGRPHRGCAHRGGDQGRVESGRSQRAGTAHRRDPVHVGTASYDHPSRDGGGVVAYSKGAADEVLASCTSQLRSGTEVSTDRVRSRAHRAPSSSAWPAKACACSPSRGNPAHRSRMRNGDDAARPRRDDGSAPSGGARRRADLRDRRHPPGDDHRRSSADRAHHRQRARDAQGPARGVRAGARRDERRGPRARRRRHRGVRARLARRQAARRRPPGRVAARSWR